MDNVPFSLLCRLCSLTKTKSRDLVSLKLRSGNDVVLDQRVHLLFLSAPTPILGGAKE